jgi:hypothetical protein
VIGEKLDEFQDRFAWVLKPLLHPVAMEVLVKPPPVERRVAVHDLDNLARNHLIPAVAAHLQPPFYGPWTIGRDEPPTATNPDGSYGGRELRSPFPKSTQIGLTRYSVFEQARESGDTNPGAVTLSLVGAESGFGEIFTRIDTVIDRWEETL